jgi:hypothetical protein
MIKTQYMLIHFGKAIAAEDINPGDPIKNVIVDDVLEEICLLSDLNIEQLEELD